MILTPIQKKKAIRRTINQSPCLDFLILPLAHGGRVGIDIEQRNSNSICQTPLRVVLRMSYDFHSSCREPRAIAYCVSLR